MVVLGTNEGLSRCLVSPDLRAVSSSKEVRNAEACASLATVNKMNPPPRTRRRNRARRFAPDHPASGSSLTSSDSDTSSSTSSTSRKLSSKEWRLRLRQEVEFHRRVQNTIQIGYSLSCYDDDDENSLSSLSGYGTDYSTSGGSVGFEGLCDTGAISGKLEVEFDIEVDGKNKNR